MKSAIRPTLSALIAAVGDFLQAVSTILTVQETKLSVPEVAPFPYKRSATSAREAADDRRREAWRERIAEYDAMSNYDKNMVGNPYDTGMAEFIGGPLNGQIHAMSEALPTFYWAQALPVDWMVLQEEGKPPLPQASEYTYERQLFFSSTGNAVYICRD